MKGEIFLPASASLKAACKRPSSVLAGLWADAYVSITKVLPVIEHWHCIAILTVYQKRPLPPRFFIIHMKMMDLGFVSGHCFCSSLVVVGLSETLKILLLSYWRNGGRGRAGKLYLRLVACAVDRSPPHGNVHVTWRRYASFDVAFVVRYQ